MSTGTCTTHSWNDGAEEDEGEPKMGLRVNQRLEANHQLYGSGHRQTRMRSRRVAADDDDDVTPSDW